MDFMYEIFGNAALTELMRVVMVSTVVTPSPTRAGAAPRLSQKDTQDIMTIRLEGMYTLINDISWILRRGKLRKQKPKG